MHTSDSTTYLQAQDINPKYDKDAKAKNTKDAQAKKSQPTKPHKGIAPPVTMQVTSLSYAFNITTLAIIIAIIIPFF